MEKMRQKLTAIRERWPRILVACLALALAFGAGMSIQAELEDVEEEEEIQNAFFNFSRQMKIFSNDVSRMTREAEQAEAAGEPVDDPVENYVIPLSLAFLREKAVTIADIADLPQSRRYPNAKIYLRSWGPAFLGGNYADLEDLSEVVTISRPLWDVETGLSCEDAMARLEENVTSEDYQDALDLLGISNLIPTTTQGGT